MNMLFSQTKFRVARYQVGSHNPSLNYPEEYRSVEGARYRWF